MLENYVGIENFRKGLKHYLTKHRYSNAEGLDLWKSIGKIAHKPVDSMMKTWIDQVGYPVVNVKRDNSKISLTQNASYLMGVKFLKINGQFQYRLKREIMKTQS